MKLKMRAYKDYASMQYKFYIYSEINGEQFFVKPIVLEVDTECSPAGVEISATFAVSMDIEFDIEGTTQVNGDMLRQKESDKLCHIENLNRIIDVLIQK